MRAMEISEVKIYPFDIGQKDSNLRAYAEVTIDDSLIIRGIRILENKKGGLFVGFPSRKGKDNEYRDYIVIKSAKFNHQLREAVLTAYREFS
jgi:stage V sporulation protein G